MNIVKVVSYGLAGLLFIAMTVAEVIPGVDPPWLLSLVEGLTALALIFLPKLQDIINPPA